MRSRPLLLLIASTGLAAASPPAQGPTAQVAPSRPWAQTRSDLRADPTVRFGTLPNGMRYAIRRNATPPGEVALRVRIDAGSLMEQQDQRGLAHFMEHMVFRGSTHLPEKELVRVLERQGLAFGADTNAFTAFDQTAYVLNVPRNDAASLDTAFRILREQVSEALLAPAAIDAERGVIAGEKRLRDGPGLRVSRSELGLLLPRVADRFPIGDMDVVRTAPRSRFKAFYDAYYRPSRATLIAVGDFDVDRMEQRIRSAFADWTPRAPDGADADPGAVAPRGFRSRILVEPGSGRDVSLIWTSRPDNSADRSAKRRQALIRELGLAVLNQRLDDLARSDHPPFLSAGSSVGDSFRAMRDARVSAQFGPGGLGTALAALEREHRRLMRYGILPGELRRQIVLKRVSLQNDVAAAGTRRTPALADALMFAVNDDQVFIEPQAELGLFEETVAGLTPLQVERILRAAFSGDGPLVRVVSPEPVEGGEAGVARSFEVARRQPVAPPTAERTLAWSYTDFGPAGLVASRREVTELGASFVTFANGATLTVKPTRFADREIQVTVGTGLGETGLPSDRYDPVRIGAELLITGGVGRMTREEMDRTLAGRVYGQAAKLGEDRFEWSGTTRPEDLVLQMQVLAALVTDPGLRAGPWERSRADYGPGLERVVATPGGAWQLHSLGLLTSGDRRTDVPSVAEVQGTELKTLAPRLRDSIARGPIDVTMVGDVTVDQAIAATAATFGALPARGPRLVAPPAGLERRFPSDRVTVQVHHTGPADQALGFAGWPTTDAIGLEGTTQSRRLSLLGAVLNERALDEIRAREGLAYAPSARSTSSTVFPRYGYIGVTAQTTPEKLPAFFAAVDGIARELQEKPIGADELERTRGPLVETIRRALTNNYFWTSALGNFATHPEKAVTFPRLVSDIESATPADIQALARRFLRSDTIWRATVTAAPTAPPLRQIRPQDGGK